MVFGLLEKDVLCATMAVTTTMGVDLGFSWVFLGVFPFDFLSYSCYSKTKTLLCGFCFGDLVPALCDSG